MVWFAVQCVSRCSVWCGDTAHRPHTTRHHTAHHCTVLHPQHPTNHNVPYHHTQSLLRTPHHTPLCGGLVFWRWYGTVACQLTFLVCVGLVVYWCVIVV